MAVATVVALALAPTYHAAGLLLGFDAGLTITVFSLLARVFAEYPYPVRSPFRFLGKLRRYWALFVAGLVYNLAIWIDKWVMWFSAEAETLPSGMVSFPDYDSAMFAAYLTIVPSLAVFLYSIETSFYEKYLRFYRVIQEHKPYRRIEAGHRDLLKELGSNVRNFLVIQLSVSISVVLLSAHIFEALNISFAQLGIFRLGVLGALFHVLFLFVSIILSYFDVRRVNLALQVLFFGSNLIFTVVSLKLGFPFYGYGYFLSSMLTFVVALLVAAYYLEDLPYHTFVRGHLAG
jgi:uncharacterized membrane protein